MKNMKDNEININDVPADNCKNFKIKKRCQKTYEEYAKKPLFLDFSFDSPNSGRYKNFVSPFQKFILSTDKLWNIKLLHFI